MAIMWKHAKLGEFSHDGLGLVCDQGKTFPGFTYAAQASGPSSFEIMFELSEGTDSPSDEAVDLAVELVESPNDLVSLITQSLLDDFQGDGPGSGVWWESDADAIEEVLGVDLPDEHGPLSALLNLIFIKISDEHRLEDVDGPIAEISFHAMFEEEHGIGFLTDGHEVFGIGYMSDVLPFGMD